MSRAPGSTPDGDGTSLPSDWTAPDDARELDPDLLKWRREQAAAAGWQTAGTSPQHRPRRRLNPPVLVATAAFVFVFGLAAAMLTPSAVRTVAPVRPLASPQAPPGQVGGLLPAATVMLQGQPRNVRALRPAVLAIAAEECDCVAELQRLAKQTTQFGVPLLLIDTEPAVVDRIRVAAPRGRVIVAQEPAGRLRSAYGGPGVAAILVRADGVVTSVERDVTRDLTGELDALTR